VFDCVNRSQSQPVGASIDESLDQKLAVLNRKIHRPKLHRRDRFFWAILSRLWKNWREVLIIVKP
jgi:hypothetical protein